MVAEVAGERSHREFLSVLCDLAVPGQLAGTSKYRLNFPAVSLPFDSYDGINVRCRYFIRLCVTRSTYSSNIISDLPFMVENSAPVRRAPLCCCPTCTHTHAYAHLCVLLCLGMTVQLPRPTMVKLEVGIEDCLHIEFEYDRIAFGLQDVVTGNVHFLLVKIKIKQMELALVRREMTGAGMTHATPCAYTHMHSPRTPPRVSYVTERVRACILECMHFLACLCVCAAGAGGATESDTLTRYELMDGCPVRNEKIPIRMYLGGIPDLIPTQSGIAGGMYSVRYFLNLVLVDEEDRRYFKQQEVTLIRLPPGEAKPAA